MPSMPALWLCQCVQTGAAVLLAGAAALRLLAWGTGLERFAGWTRLTWGSALALLGSAWVQLTLNAASMSGLPLARALACPVLGEVLNGTTFGRVWKVRVGLLVLVLLTAALLAAVRRRHRFRAHGAAALELAGALLAAAVLASLVWSGHAHASDRRAWLLPTDILHAVAAGAWPGGLLPLALLLARARRTPVWVPSVVIVARRFSRLSVSAVGVLALSGLVNGLGLVGTLGALWPSLYGRLILGKAALFAAMVGLGAVNRRALRPGDLDDPAQTLRGLWRNVAWECALAVGVILATEALALSAPPASAG